METVNVECYSGGRFAERPTALTWRGERLNVKSVERAWQTPDGVAFVVCIEGGRRFELAYMVSDDHWSARLIEI